LNSALAVFYYFLAGVPYLSALTGVSQGWFFSSTNDATRRPAGSKLKMVA
jgi:hypothetical protein